MPQLILIQEHGAKEGMPGPALVETLGLGEDVRAHSFGYHRANEEIPGLTLMRTLK
jgi:hypothetical protein